MVRDRPGQLTRRTNPQMLQVATPLRGSNSRRLGHPLVPQKSLELTAAAVDRRRIRRIAEARPVTDDVVERFIIGVFVVLSGAPSSRDVRSAALPVRFAPTASAECGAFVVWSPRAVGGSA